MAAAPVLTKSVNPLANPKGVKNVCELCGKPAFVQCSKCKITFYCSYEHQRIDWVGIHESICTLVGELKTSGLPFLGSEEERRRRNQERVEKQKKVIMMTRTMGQKLLFEKRFSEAIPAALQSLKYSIAVFGTSSIELVISYLILAEASIGLDRLDQAEQYLSQAEWTVLKTDNVGNDYKAKLYKNMGLLYDAKKNYQEALRNFANGIYYASEEYGTDDIHTSSAYFYMANVFLKQQRSEVTASMYKQVTDIWLHKFEELCNIGGVVSSSSPHSSESQSDPTPDNMGVTRKSPTKSRKGVPHLDIAQKAEARQVLSCIHDYWNNIAPQPDPPSYSTLLLTLAYMEFYLGNPAQCRNLLDEAKRTLTDSQREKLEVESVMEKVDQLSSHLSAES